MSSSADQTRSRSHSLSDGAVRCDALFCQTGASEWHRVVSFNQDGVVVTSCPVSFEQYWQMAPTNGETQASEATRSGTWQDLQVPLPSPDVRCWGYALTYPAHRIETGRSRSLLFKKGGAAQLISRPVDWRPFLDYEAEIGILMHRDDPERFGYLMLNDLTDRKIQLETYDRRDPAPGFSAAKSFDGALRIGPVILIGSVAEWDTLEIVLKVNGEMRQHVRARECLLEPAEFHRQVFRQDPAARWILVATGTTAGTVFKQPTPVGKLKLFLTSGLSMGKAKQRLLDEMRFLEPGDTLSMESASLGISTTTVIQETQTEQNTTSQRPVCGRPE